MMSRRHLLLGAAASLSGCKVFDDANRADSGLRGLFEAVSPLNRRLLQGDALAREYSRADIRQGMRPNGSVDPSSAEYLAHQLNGFADYRLAVTGLVEVPLLLPLAEVRAMPARSQITRHDCVEGWSCIAEWTGVPLSALLARARPKAAARYVVFHCHDAIERSLSGVVTYYESLDLREAMHPQTILAHGMNGAPLPVANGAPLRLRVERQLGYKMAKYVHTVELVESFAGLGYGRGSYWADRGYEWYAGI